MPILDDGTHPPEHFARRHHWRRIKLLDSSAVGQAKLDVSAANIDRENVPTSPRGLNSIGSKQPLSSDSRRRPS